MSTYIISYLPPTPGELRERIITKDTVEEAKIEFYQQKPFYRIMNITIKNRLI